MNTKHPPECALHSAKSSRRSRTIFLAIAVGTTGFLSSLSAQTAIVVLNSGFESPTPTSLPGYTVGATYWTQTRLDINAGTFAPSLASPANPDPLPKDGVQVGYADGSGGLRQVFTETYASSQLYTFSVWIGVRSDLMTSTQGTGAIAIGTFDAGTSTFTPFSTQTKTVNLGDFDFVSGSYQTTGASLGLPIALQLTSVGSFQVLFDQVQLSYTAIPEPATFAGMFGAAALIFAWSRRRMRSGTRPAVVGRGA